MVSLAIESYAKIIIAIFAIAVLSGLILYVTGVYKSFISEKFQANNETLYANVTKDSFFKLLYTCWKRGESSNLKKVDCYIVSLKDSINKSDIQSYASSSGVPVNIKDLPAVINKGNLVVIYYEAGLVRVKVYR
jgi:hypothetical protein